MDGLLALSQRELTHLLFLLDPWHVPEQALTAALDFSEDRCSQITIMHGGRLVNSLAPGTQADYDENRRGLLNLICLYWQIKNRYQNVSMSPRVPRSAQEVLIEAANGSADLIMLPEVLLDRFEHLLAVDRGYAVLLFSRCPIVIISSVTSSVESSTSDINWFRYAQNN